MKSLIVLVVGLLAIGCMSETEKLEEENRRLKAQIENDKLKAEIEAENEKKRLIDSVIGEYECKNENGDTHKLVLLDSGIGMVYFNGERMNYNYWHDAHPRWSIVDGEIHFKTYSGIGVGNRVYRINADKSITLLKKDGEETYFWEVLNPYKKIK